MKIISSKENKLIKDIIKLKIKRYRQQNNEFMIEGLRFVEEAVTAGVKVKYCLISKILTGDRIELIIKKMTDRNIETYLLDDNLFKDICDTYTPQGIVAVVERDEYDLSSILKEKDFVILTDRIQDPGNMGTIIRTSDAAAAAAVIISEGNVDPYSPKVLRSTMGSIFHIPVMVSSCFKDTICRLKENGFYVYASSPEGTTRYYQANYKNKTAIIIGNEANGIDNEIMKISDNLINIPMPGNSESINAAVACGILLFEVVRQRTL